MLLLVFVVVFLPSCSLSFVCVVATSSSKDDKSHDALMLTHFSFVYVAYQVQCQSLERIQFLGPL